MPGLITKLFSAGAEKEIKRFQKIVDRVNELGPRYEKMTDEELAALTPKFRERVDRGESLDRLLPEAFAAVREMSGRVLHMRHFDVQVMGAIALHEGMIAEMKTGEGKTLVATLAVYLNALEGKGVHMVTVNDYLARRDSEWMGRLYRAMGLKVGLLQNGMPLRDKLPAYEADVTYGTNSEFGFDYLRDNMVRRRENRVQRGHHYAIVDEVDSILIDEARTPLIISGPGRESKTIYRDFAIAVRGLIEDVDFEKDEAKHTINATDSGLEKIEKRLRMDIYGKDAGELVNHLQQALKAEYLFDKGKQYIIQDGEIKIVDEFTGRIMEGRRYSDGLHQAIEAKEGITVREENLTHATITLQNYFRIYEKLAGMTGTAMTEDSEFRQIYHLPVQSIPPNRPVIRVDHDDLIYVDKEHKLEAIAEDVRRRHDAGQPILIGTPNIEASKEIAYKLAAPYVNADGEHVRIDYLMLNGDPKTQSKADEAEIIAQAGQKGKVTIATNMAGRGTDILLGGNPEGLVDYYLNNVFHKKHREDATEEELEEALRLASEDCAQGRKEVLAAGGLYVIGVERHEARRIDNQLRGRSGRQGDPGESQFYLSLEDDLMRLFGADKKDRIEGMMSRLGMPPDLPIQAKMVTKAVEGAQHKVEEINFSMRKNVLDYDDVMNQQREAIYDERNRILDGEDLVGHVEEVMEKTVARAIEERCPKGSAPEEWDTQGLAGWLANLTDSPVPASLVNIKDRVELEKRVYTFLKTRFDAKRVEFGPELLDQLSQRVMLDVIDSRWVTYLQEMEYLKTGIGLRGYGQRDPLVEYKAEAFRGFQLLTNALYEDYLRVLLRLKVVRREPEPAPESEPEFQGATFSGPSELAAGQATARAAMAAPVEERQPVAVTMSGGGAPQASPRSKTYRKSESGDPYANVGRNDPCPCGSGKKFKNCHGRRR